MLAPARRADRVLSLLLIASDLFTVPLTFFLTFWIRVEVIGDAVPGFDVRLPDYMHTIPAIWFLWFASFAWAGLYRPRRYLGSMGEVQKTVKALATMMVAMMAASYMVQEDYSRLMLLIFTVLALPLASFMRVLARRLSQILAPVTEVPRILIVGTGEVGRRVRRSLERLPGRHPVIAGFISTDPAEAGPGDDIEGIPVAGMLPDLPGLLAGMGIDEVFFASSKLPRGRILEVISSVENRSIHYRLVSDLFEISSSSTDLDDLARLPIIEIGQTRTGVLSASMKRLFDIVFSLALIILLGPVLLLVFAMLLVGGKGTPVFSQTRVGRRGVPFTFYKFRTMRPESGEYEVAPLTPDDPRVTPFGRFLRRTSLDELPQLFNVLTGSMSMVGPRPEMPFIVEGYSDWQRRRLEVRPGLTGLWQIMGRKDLPLHDNIEYDFYYIRNQSMMLDFTILLRTVATVFRGRGAY